MTPVDMTTNFLEDKQAEVNEWLAEAEHVVLQYEDVRRVHAALMNVEYKPEIIFGADTEKLEKQIAKLESQLAGEREKVIALNESVQQLNDVIQAQPPSEIDVPVTRKPDAPPVEKPDEAKPPRKPPVDVKVEAVRDWAVKLGRKFTLDDMCQEFNCTKPTASRKLKSLVSQGILVRHMVPHPGSPPRAEFERTEVTTPNPRNHPTHDRPNSGGGGRQSQVPGTGRPHGPAPTPGKLKRQQQKAARVKHKPVKGVRV